MSKKLDCILLVDDSEADNFLNQMTINEIGCTKHVVAVESAMEGLNYLKDSESGVERKPDLIMLDINMPAVNGWEFIREYQKLDNDFHGETKIVVLTSSQNPKDIERAFSFNEVSDFRNKPITREMIQDIVLQFFPDYV
ncbi:MAG: response regulator [Calditrichaeota bacterium]|nr:response regulator [Calditrichota bacterium]